MSRFRFILVAAAAFLAAAVVSPQPSVAQMAGAAGITGDWSVHVTGDEFKDGKLHLRQQGSSVVGSAPAKGGTVQITGTLTNSKMSGTWRGANHETGWMTVTFASDGKGFNGEWGYHGTKPNGKLIGTRV